MLRCALSKSDRRTGQRETGFPAALRAEISSEREHACKDPASFVTAHSSHLSSQWQNTAGAGETPNIRDCSHHRYKPDGGQNAYDAQSEVMMSHTVSTFILYLLLLIY